MVRSCKTNERRVSLVDHSSLTARLSFYKEKFARVSQVNNTIGCSSHLFTQFSEKYLLIPSAHLHVDLRPSSSSTLDPSTMISHNALSKQLNYPLSPCFSPLKLYTVDDNPSHIIRLASCWEFRIVLRFSQTSEHHFDELVRTTCTKTGLSMGRCG